MKILHIKGTMCSGKTFAVTPFLSFDGVAYWDVMNFYEDHGCFRDDRTMDWDVWEEEAPKIPQELHGFLEENKDQKICIIESGTNARVEETLRGQSCEVISIELGIPENDELKRRTKERELDWEVVKDYTKMYLRRHAHRREDWLTCEEARLIIQAHLEGKVEASIIGTAGRKEDKDKMSKALYVRMFKKAVELFKKYRLRPEQISLVSGGAAWSDHIAVSLYLADYANDLTLHMPSAFDSVTDKRFVGTQTADTANYYHTLFSEKMGGSTLDGICKAIEKGADIKIHKGFKTRNLEVAQCDLMIAFTWGEGDVPKDGGTKHTWDHSDCPLKIHVPLSGLEDNE